MIEKLLQKDSELWFLPLGGCGEIGMNLNLYAYQNQWLMVDLGVTFGNELGVDVLMPDPTFIEKRKDQLVGLVLTHAHEDHIGAVPYLWERFQCPIYATPFTAWLVREKLKEAGLEKRAVITEIPLGGTVKIGPFSIDWITITHSIPEPNVLAIKTPVGTIIHTGDWKVDPHPMIGQATDEETLKKFGDEGVLALVCDSTNVFVEGRTGSEADVRTKLSELVARQQGRVIIACFASNVARLESCAIAAEDAGRRAILMGRSLLRMESVARRCGYLKGIEPFCDEDRMRDLQPENTLIICTGSQGEPRSALMRLATNQHPRMRLQEGDTVIFSSRVIPGNEQAIKFMKEALVQKGVTVIAAAYDDDIHVSGHPARDELRDMYEWVRPQILIPVHGEQAHLREHAHFALSQGIPESIVPKNGALIQIAPGKPRILQEVENGRLALDGSVLVPYSGAQMRDRHRLMNSGVVLITARLSKKYFLKEIVQISLLGVVEEGQEEETLEIVKDALFAAFEHRDLQKIGGQEGAKEYIRLTARRVINALRAKKPTVVVHVCE